MQAIVQDRFGKPDVLELREVDQPAIGDDGVLVRVRAASVNPADWYAMAGFPYVARPQMELRTPRARLGLDVAGEVVAVGERVTRFKAGDEVFGAGTGTLAEYAAAPEDALVAKPANLSFEQAAAVPVAGLTALQGLRDKGGIRPGRRVLINGASGGVGTFAVQVAKAFGADVTGVCSPRNVDLVASLGADQSSTTPGRTSPGPAAATTCCSTSPGAGRGRRAGGCSTRRRPSSWSGRPRAAGCSGRWITSSGSAWPRCGRARRCVSSSRRRARQTWRPWGSCSRPGRSPRWWSGATRCATPRRRCVPGPGTRQGQARRHRVTVQNADGLPGPVR
jgi:threonine dehydrogenase-like Zn-dependent dehydrogenase